MGGHDDSIADLLRSTIRDAQELVRGEVALARAELREEARRIGAGAAALAAAAVAAVIAAVFLLTAVAWAIADVFGWPAWAGFAGVGAVVAIAGLVLAKRGRNRLNGDRHMPRTVDTMKENFRWMRARTS